MVAQIEEWLWISADKAESVTLRPFWAAARDNPRPKRGSIGRTARIAAQRRRICDVEWKRMMLMIEIRPLAKSHRTQSENSLLYKRSPKESCRSTSSASLTYCSKIADFHDPSVLSPCNRPTRRRRCRGLGVIIFPPHRLATWEWSPQKASLPLSPPFPFSQIKCGFAGAIS